MSYQSSPQKEIPIPPNTEYDSDVEVVGEPYPPSLPAKRLTSSSGGRGPEIPIEAAPFYYPANKGGKLNPLPTARYPPPLDPKKPQSTAETCAEYLRTMERMKSGEVNTGAVNSGENGGIYPEFAPMNMRPHTYMQGGTLIQYCGVQPNGFKREVKDLPGQTVNLEEDSEIEVVGDTNGWKSDGGVLVDPDLELEMRKQEVNIQNIQNIQNIHQRHPVNPRDNELMDMENLENPGEAIECSGSVQVMGGNPTRVDERGCVQEIIDCHLPPIKGPARIPQEDIIDLDYSDNSLKETNEEALLESIHRPQLPQITDLEEEAHFLRKLEEHENLIKLSSMHSFILARFSYAQTNKIYFFHKQKLKEEDVEDPNKLVENEYFSLAQYKVLENRRFRDPLLPLSFPKPIHSNRNIIYTKIMDYAACLVERDGVANSIIFSGGNLRKYVVCKYVDRRVTQSVKRVFEYRFGNENEISSNKTRKFIKRQDMKYSRAAHHLVVNPEQTHLYAIGGHTYLCKNSKKFSEINWKKGGVKEVEKFDIRRGSWSEISPLPTATGVSLTSKVIGCCIFTGLGGNSGFEEEAVATVGKEEECVLENTEEKVVEERHAEEDDVLNYCDEFFDQAKRMGADLQNPTAQVFGEEEDYVPWELAGGGDSTALKEVPPLPQSSIDIDAQPVSVRESDTIYPHSYIYVFTLDNKDTYIVRMNLSREEEGWERIPLRKPRDYSFDDLFYTRQITPQLILLADIRNLKIFICDNWDGTLRCINNGPKSKKYFSETTMVNPMFSAMQFIVYGIYKQWNYAYEREDISSQSVSYLFNGNKWVKGNGSPL